MGVGRSRNQSSSSLFEMNGPPCVCVGACRCAVCRVWWKSFIGSHIAIGFDDFVQSFVRIICNFLIDKMHSSVLQFLSVFLEDVSSPSASTLEQSICTDATRSTRTSEDKPKEDGNLISAIKLSDCYTVHGRCAITGHQKQVTKL